MRKVKAIAFAGVIAAMLVYATNVNSQTQKDDGKKEPAPAAEKVQDAGKPGDIVVGVKDELGNTVVGATVELRLPGPDGKLLSGADSIWEIRDGDKEPKDGIVTYPASKIASVIKPGESYQVTVNAQMFVETKTVNAYSVDAVDNADVTLPYVLKVTVSRNGGKPVTGFRVEAGRVDAFDGGKNDADNETNGAIYVINNIIGKANEATVNLTVSGQGFKKAFQANLSNKVQRSITIDLGKE